MAGEPKDLETLMGVWLVILGGVTVGLILILAAGTELMGLIRSVTFSFLIKLDSSSAGGQ